MVVRALLPNTTSAIREKSVPTGSFGQSGLSVPFPVAGELFPDPVSVSTAARAMVGAKEATRSRKCAGRHSVTAPRGAPGASSPSAAPLAAKGSKSACANATTAVRVTPGATESRKRSFLVHLTGTNVRSGTSGHAGPPAQLPAARDPNSELVSVKMEYQVIQLPLNPLVPDSHMRWLPLRPNWRISALEKSLQET